MCKYIMFVLNHGRYVVYLHVMLLFSVIFAIFLLVCVSISCLYLIKAGASSSYLFCYAII
jgi:hypothetical protein